MTDGGENCQVKVPAVLLLEMTSAYIQVLIPCPSITPLHSMDFQLLWSSDIGLHKLRTTYAFSLFINLSLVKY